MNSLASELRAEFDRIIKRNFGLPNALGAVRIETAEKVLAYVDEAEARRCTCCQEPTFEPRERDDSKHSARMFARFATAEADYQRACAKLRRAV